MATEVSFTKRAAAELSRRFNGLTVRSRSQQQQQQNASNNAAATPSKQQTAVSNSNSNLGNANNSNIQLTCFTAVAAPESAAGKKHHHHHQQHHHHVRATGTRTARIAELFQGRARAVDELWLDHAFLTTLFFYVTPLERTVLAQVCRSWRDVLYRQPRFWHGVLPVLHCRDMRCAKDLNATSELRKRIYQSLEQRGFPCLCLFGCNDDDVYDIVSNFPQGHVRHLRCLQLRCCNVTDKGHEVLLEFLCGVAQLSMSGCNEVTDAGLWASLTPRITHLTLSDCINVADESVAAITQLLPNLRELNLQAYHVTDAALAFFGPQHGSSLSVLRLRSCWELTNHGLLNLVHALPNLSVLSLSGCSKVTDDGVELLAENLRQLRVLDLSWCPRITDAALEYIACDLGLLEELTLDRCVHVTDIGVGYLSTMVNLRVLYLRWCTQIRDFGLQHLCSMRSLQVLSLAGCALLTSSGLSSLVQLRDLRELELTNCAGSSEELFEYLHEHLPMCLVIE